MDKHTPGTGKFECDGGLVVERFADGGCSFDIFDAVTWPGGDEEGHEYAALVLRAVNSHADLLAALEKIEGHDSTIDASAHGGRRVIRGPYAEIARAAIAAAEG